MVAALLVMAAITVLLVTVTVKHAKPEIQCNAMAYAV